MEAVRFVPYLPVANVTAEYPPALLIHGEADTDVPAEQSEMMAEKFRQHGVPHRLHLVPRAEHGLKGSDPAIVRASEREAAEFLRHHLFPPPAREKSQ